MEMSEHSRRSEARRSTSSPPPPSNPAIDHGGRRARERWPAPKRRAAVTHRLRIALVLAPLAVAGCHRGTPAPHRLETPANLPQDASTIVVPVSARLADLEQGINEQLPATLWSIDRQEPECVPAKQVKVFGKALKVTPRLSCRIVGRVTHGRAALTGSGQLLTLTLPVTATVSAEGIGGLVKRETATGSAVVHANIRLSVHPDWSPAAAVDVHYDWTDAPGVTLFGKRITFTDKADDKLQGVIAKLKEDLPRQLARLDARGKVAAAWQQGFTSIQLNRDNPPVWLRIAPQRISFDGYRIVGTGAGARLELTAAAQALTQTFVGAKPPDLPPTPLPPLSRDVAAPSLAFAVPVLADYRELEPVLLRALTRLADRKGIVVPHLGRVDAHFTRVTMYATDGNRLAVGVELAAKLRSGLLGTTTGMVWLTGVPFNEPNSEVIQIRDLKATGSTDSHSVNLLLTIVESPTVLAQIRGSLTQNFGKDYAKILASARAAIAERRQGDIVLAARIDRVTHGRIVPTGQGLFVPLHAAGTATIAYRPQ